MPLIGICGGTASGKSTLAKQIKSYFSKIGVVCIVSDSYYKDHYSLNFKERSKINFDHPDSIDFELLVKNLKKEQYLSSLFFQEDFFQDQFVHHEFYL